MSEGDVWYFARGQEVVGPFSREILRQIHEGGQLPLETLVWREGLEGWKPAGQVAELGLGTPSPAAPGRLKPPVVPPPSRAAAPAGPSPDTGVSPPADPGPPVGPKLKIKVRSAGPMTEGPAPSTMLRKTLAPDGQTFPSAPKAPDGEVPIAGHGTKKAPSWFQRTVSRVFSSLVMTPLFLIAAAVLAVLAGSDFPNILGLLWIFLAFGLFGAVSLLGMRGFDGVFRWLALLVFVPSLAMFWPVIMREVPVSHATGGQWFFLVFCFLYYLTMRIGLRPYLGGLGVFAVVSGLATLTILMGIWKTDLEKGIPGWEAMVKAGAEVRLPGVVARWLNMPEIGTREGTLRLRFGKEVAEVGIERAALELKGTEGWRFTMVLLSGQQLSARFKPVAEGSEFASVVGRDATLAVSAAGLTSREGLDEVDTLSAAKALQFNGKSLELAGGSVRITEIGAERVRGTVVFSIAGQKEPVPLDGEFDTKMVRR